MLFHLHPAEGNLEGRWKGAGVGGERVEDGEVILSGRCLEELGPALAEDTGEAASPKGSGPASVDLTSMSDSTGDLFGPQFLLRICLM